jgi:hypothetical protein
MDVSIFTGLERVEPQVNLIYRNHIAVCVINKQKSFVIFPLLNGKANVPMTSNRHWPRDEAQQETVHQLMQRAG